MTEAAGATVEVEIMADKDQAQMWDLVTDVARIGEWSPECVGAAWLDGSGAEPGRRFEGHNEYEGGFSSTVTCVVTEARRPDVFEFVVLDPSELPERPGSIWRYELAPGRGPGQTRVRHRFVHGPGLTGLSEGMRENPDQAAAILQSRLDKLHKHMTVTTEGMAAS
jgi:polyketide cyclase/dehydrase/lipid transport protein